ncbi:hypothetical protein [Geminocystis sp. NIES-3709]|uniref:hypothetical protein n=1 Tax=Geminocystis sp. NIES-3709 TaxID=1617448 RepID=UPI0005FCCA3A|nr:hypothetical protein [Geminocystis sp. NIES-3709]BAQ63731.1 hypothetical protein GM3709_496 [Geminocystis sp. NIES-3709]
MNQPDYLLQCRQILKSAITELGFSLTEDKIWKIAGLIIEGMSGKWRNFHTFEHILMVSNTGDPLITLAGLFHDLIYLQVDQIIPFNLTPYLNLFIYQKENNFYIKSKLLEDDHCFSIVLEIFDLNLGDNLLPSKGQNEFLSALIAAKILESDLPLSVITRIVTIIELTIPFRQCKNDNTTIPLELQKRLEKVNQKFNLDLTSEEIIITIEQAVKLANLDVSGFAASDVTDFINNTWLLLPETNHSLNDTLKYTVKDYRFALVNTTKFINFISPELIFHQYQNEPNIETFQELINRCENNLNIARLYLAVKLVGISILEALSSHLLPNIPLAFLWGFSEENHPHSSIFDFLPSFSPCKIHNEQEKLILDLLNFQFQRNLFSPTNHSLFSTFIVNYLSFEEVIKYQSQCYLFFNNLLSREDFLSLFPPTLITLLSNAIAQLLEEKQLGFIKEQR